MPTAPIQIYSNIGLQPYYSDGYFLEDIILAPNVVVKAGTVLGEVTATPGTAKAYASGNADGSQVPKWLAQFDMASDATGAITLGANALAAPAAAPTLATATTGGTVLAGTYQVEVTYVSPSGETVASAPGSITTTGTTSTITVTPPPSIPGATGWKAYFTAAGGAVFYLQGGTNALANTFVLTAPPSTASANPPTAGTAYVGTAGGQWGETFTSAPAYYRGTFKAADLIGLDANAVSPATSGWRLLHGILGGANTLVTLS